MGRYVPLPGPRRGYLLLPTLALVEKLCAEKHLVSLARDLVSGMMPAKDISACLYTVYAASGCLLAAPVLERFLQTQDQVKILRLVLQAMLCPLTDMGVSGPSGVDITALRRFFLGVLRWTPRTLREEASLQDLCDAWLGFQAFHGTLTMKVPPLGKTDLQRLMQLHPDEAVEKEVFE